MLALDLFPNSRSSPLHHPLIPHKRALFRRDHRHTPPPCLYPPRRRYSPLRFRSGDVLRVRCGGGSYGGLEVDVDQLRATGVSGVPVELSFTKTLPPALTLRHAVVAMREEVEKLKADPPCSRSGVLRFQVAVPPSIKPLNWFCSQCKSFLAFPQFYLSRQQNCKLSHAMGLEEGMLGVSGIGSAICFHSSLHTPEGCNSIGRYLSVDSPLIRTYGFIGMNYDKELSLVVAKAGSLYLFIPQIELDEFESFSFLASTIVWDDSLSHTFEKAVHSFELHLGQITQYVTPINGYCQDIWINSIQGPSSLGDVKEFQMVYMNAETLAKKCKGSKCLQQEESLTSYLSYMRFSSAVSVSTDMFSGPRITSCLIRECSNINLVWASLIVEECVRLGLTYFCIAPGSRSSPLAIAACSHSRTTCISCFDERSLAFHAVGYARGSHKPAVVITSSGTAVSNLLPAVVEASHAFVPVLLLTADRPPELHDAGANQAIDQVNHFGKFVKFFFSLPPPTDQIPARMVLTTIDSAIYNATLEPSGPVHVNCPFREPLDDRVGEWTMDCLKGLDLWLSKEEPFTKYIKMKYLNPYDVYHAQVIEVTEIIQSARKGLLLIGDVHTEDEIWAALILARHLFWPVAADILSGLRLRRSLTSFPEIEDHLLFLDHLDHVLISEFVRSWAQPDVVVQIGSRITSKRINQLLEFCSPCSYILVDKHPFRHDPSHIVTHRIQSTITEFAGTLLKVEFPRKTSTWRNFLRALDMTVAQEISFQIHSELSLSEPHVAHVMAEVIQGDAAFSALFIGNSMVIRDMDMYGKGWVNSINNNVYLMSNWEPKFLGLQVAGNRGASGIDGLLSTAIGFSVGCNKRVFCLIGDVSFLHDANGLAILSQRIRRKPMTILVINNHGGAIFSLLPIADTLRPEILDRYFYTSHDVSIGKLCEAHSVKHLQVRTKMELQDALWNSQKEQSDCVIEVKSCIADNANFHSILRKSACQAADQALNILLASTFLGHIHSNAYKIQKMEYSLYRIELCDPPTSSHVDNGNMRFHREGYILTVFLDDGSTGLGEVAPVETRGESLLDVEEQLRFLIDITEGTEISYFLPLLKGSFSHWIWRGLGIPVGAPMELYLLSMEKPSSIFPSVRCGMEMAMLNALAARQGCSLLDVLVGYKNPLQDYKLVRTENVHGKRSARIPICALVASKGTPKEVAHVVSQLIDEGFMTIKLKVARRGNPIEDAAVIQEIRQMVGYQVKIRVDANRGWTYEEAVQFGNLVKHFDLQYIEEPICNEDDIIKFCEETGLPAALDETIDNLEGDILHRLEEFVHPGIVAVVIKPTTVGGFEKAALIAKWAQQHEKMAVVSSAFESSLSLSSYVQFARYIEQQNMAICRIKNKELSASLAHGLGTYRWLKKDLTTKLLKVCVHTHGGTMEASMEDAESFLRYFQINQETVQRVYRGEQVTSYHLKVDSEDFSCSIKVQEAESNINSKTLVFLHGFLGTSQDWIPIMKAISRTARCISLDLPGHGESKMQWLRDRSSKSRLNTSIDLVADILLKLICDITSGDVTLVGYSMGARIALYMALKYSEKIDGAVIISGSPGLRDEASRGIRTIQDKAKARYLSAHGLECFLDTWYAGKLWESLRNHPQFVQIKSSRLKHNDIQALAKCLSDLSIGNQQSLWEDLKHCKKPLLFIVGEKDTKFKDISQQMYSEVRSSKCEDCKQGNNLCEMVVVPDSGHAVHLENPLPVIKALREFITELDR